jgi:hypothetical protein
MIIRSILILTMLALVLGGVGAAVVQAQTTDLDPATQSVKVDPSDARHDDIKPDLEAVEVKADDGPDKRDSNAHHGHHHHARHHHHHHHTCVT